VVDGIDLGVVIGHVLDKFGSLGSDLSAGLDSFLLQAAIPRANLLPALKGGKLDIRRWQPATCRLVRFFFLFGLILICRFVFELRPCPGEDVASTFLGNQRFAGWAFPFHRAVAGDANLEFLTQQYEVVGKDEAVPKLARDERLSHMPV